MERYSNVLRYKRCHLFPTLTVYSERGSEGRRIEKWIQMMKRVEVSRVHEESALEQKSRKKKFSPKTKKTLISPENWPIFAWGIAEFRIFGK